MTRGYRLAAVTLLIEIVLALGLPSDAMAMFALFAMLLVGLLFLPAAWMIWADARAESNGGTLVAYVIAGACGLAGGGCLLVVGRVLLMTLVTLQG